MHFLTYNKYNSIIKIGGIRMKTITKRFLSVAVVLAMVLSMFTICFTSTSAEAVVPRAIQRQWDAKWKNYYIGGRTMYQTACGIFSIVNTVGYVTGNEMDVMEVGRWANSIGAFNTASFGGTDRSVLYPRLQARYGKDYGFTIGWMGYATAASSTLKNHLAGGGVAIGHVPGHFIAIVGYDSSTNKFHVYDSAPSSSRGTNTTGATGYGDCWVTQSRLSTGKLDLDWFCLMSGTGYPINLDYGEEPGAGTKAEAIGTYRVNSKAPTTDPLNVRAGAGSSYEILGTMTEGALCYGSELSGSWVKIKEMSTGLEGWVSGSYVDYIGIDALSGTGSPQWGEMSTSVDENGQLTIVNESATDAAAYDFYLPIALGTKTTPYMSLQVTPNYGNGFYFGLSQQGSGFWMMRDCTSSDQLVVADSAPFMTGQETLEINLIDWWKPTDHQTIDQVRFYIAPSSSVTFNYFYFATTSKKVTDTTYNLVRGNSSVNPAVPFMNETLMDPDTLSVVDRTKIGGYVYDNGMLTVTSGTADGYAVKFDVNKSFKPEELQRWVFSVSAEVRYDIELVVTTSEGDRTVGLVSDFWPAVMGELDGDYIPAMTGSRGLDLYSMYTWNNVLPADGVSVIKSVKIEVGGQGAVAVNALQIANEDIISVYNDGAYQEETTPSVSLGDVNLDGFVNTSDALLAMRYALSDDGLFDDSLLAADYNGDGVVTTTDARLMMLAALMD